MNQKVLIGIIVGLLVLGGFLFLKPQEANDVVNNSAKVKTEAKTEAPKVDSVVKKQGEVPADDLNIDNIEGEITYYYSFTCGHCKDVNEFLEKNDIASKVDFVKKEISKSVENSKGLSEAAQKCGMNPGNIGVPFLFADGKCYMGGPNVRGFFSKAAGL